MDAGLPFDREVGSGDPAATLIEITERHRWEGIVAGACCLGALRGAILGCVSPAFLHASKVAVTGSSARTQSCETSGADRVGDAGQKPMYAAERWHAFAAATLDRVPNVATANGFPRWILRPIHPAVSECG